MEEVQNRLCLLMDEQIQKNAKSSRNKVIVAAVIITLILVSYPLWSVMAVGIMSIIIGDCGHSGTVVGIINKKCQCKGLSWSAGWFGGNTKVCIGKCHNCQCSQSEVEKSSNTVISKQVMCPR